MSEPPNGRRARGGLTAEERKRLNDLVTRSVQKVLDARESASESEKDLARSMLSCFQAGLTWQEIASLTGPLGINTSQAVRLRAESVMDRQEADSQGVSVSEAASRLGVQRTTVYRRIDRGELQVFVDARGRTRVILND